MQPPPIQNLQTPRIGIHLSLSLFLHVLETRLPAHSGSVAARLDYCGAFALTASCDRNV